MALEGFVDLDFMSVIRCFWVMLRPRLVVQRFANDGSLPALVCRLPHGKGMSVWDLRASHFPTHVGLTGAAWEPIWEDLNPYGETRLIAGARCEE